MRYFVDMFCLVCPTDITHMVLSLKPQEFMCVRFTSMSGFPHWVKIGLMTLDIMTTICTQFHRYLACFPNSRVVAAADSVDSELPLFEQLTYDDIRETKTCETSLCSSPRMEETSCTEKDSPTHIASACSSLWSSDSTERSCNLSDRESLNWDLQGMQYEHRRHKQPSS